MTAPLGFIGCGHMGGAMALRLAEAGYSLVVCDPDATRLEPLLAKGAIAAATPREVADRAEIVFACLPSQKISRDVAYGDDGVVGGKAIRIYIESSTIGQPTIARNRRQACGREYRGARHAGQRRTELGARRQAHHHPVRTEGCPRHGCADTVATCRPHHRGRRQARARARSPRSSTTRFRSPP